MDLVYCVVTLGLAVILFVISLLGARRPDEPGWASGGVISDVWSVTIVGLLAFGVSFGAKFFVKLNQEPFGIKEVALLSAVLAACYLTLRVMAPRRRLAEYAAEIARRSGASESHPANVVPLASAESETRPMTEPTFPRAA